MKILADFTTPITGRKRRSMNCFEHTKRLNLGKNIFFHQNGKSLWVCGGRRGCRGSMIPTKMTSEHQDLQNDLQAPRNCLPALVMSPSLPPFCLHTLHFGSNKKIFGFYIHQKPFFRNSQHDEIIQNDTLTI